MLIHPGYGCFKGFPCSQSTVQIPVGLPDLKSHIRLLLFFHKPGSFSLMLCSINLTVQASAGKKGLFDTHLDRKSTRLNSSHVAISYAVFCLKKKKNITN